MSSVTSPLPSLTPEVLKMRRTMESPTEDSDQERTGNPSVSPLPPAASPALASPKREPPTSPVMLATMTPVSVVEYEEQEAAAAAAAAAQQKTVIFIPPGQSSQETVIYDNSSQNLESSNGPVSVVVQPPGTQLINQTATYQGPPGTTVLVLSELVEDMSPLLGIRKRKEAGEEGRMAEGEAGGPGEEGGWRAYYEHPLTAATTAMLNISGGPSEEQPPSSMGFIYEYYKLPQLSDKEKLSEIWPTTSASGASASLLSSQIRSANGVVSDSGLQLSAPPLGDLQGLFLHHHQPSHVKREPEDLSHHRKTTDKSRHKVVLVTTAGGHPDLVVDVVNNNNNTTIKDEFIHSPQHGSRSINGTPSSTSSLITGDNAPIEIITTDGLKTEMYNNHIFTAMSNAQPQGSGTPSPIPYSEHATQYTTSVSQGSSGYVTTSAGRGSASSGFADPYYREYFSEQSPYGGTVRQATYADSPEGAGSTAAVNASLMDRYVRGSAYHSTKGVIAAAGLTVDLPSPDSGIGADAITPRDQAAIQQSFDYSEMCGTPLLEGAAQRANPTAPGARSRPWHDFGRQSDADKIQIPKVYNQYGFRYHLETPISTNQRREDDRVTYINKGQFYGISMEYVPDPDKPLKAQTVKSIVMLMFREEKSPEDEIKAWQFWHGRQHSVKQRILDADTKNSVGLVGCIEEVSHNAIAVYWNPLESSAKINIAVQCLSTDFSSQKGVKGLPLHLQIDTYEDTREGPVFHRGYCQIKVFCDKGAERKTRDEERRAAKRKMTATGRKKMDELYHPACDRSEFYHMQDLAKPPVLFSPAEDIDKLTSMELQGFYGHETDTSSLSNGEAGSLKHTSPFLLHSGGKGPSTPTLKFHNHFPPDTLSPPLKRPKMVPPLNERVMLYVRQDAEDVYTPLHVAPPTTTGLLNAIENKYKISTSSISNLYRKNKKGIIAKIDDEMLKYYCNEDMFLLEVRQSDESEDLLDILLVELMDH
ncbi:protein grainyhead isoform X3 [Homalodisca vitripennis]|uniref:protein grainyhead isoform X3 n=1 Tax=Homalodisca vitripennis TaxID=197043 RepID=UPI001EEB6CF3|nr:protein grainyhead isoform X3 [Homalodisca vitripennis]